MWKKFLDIIFPQFCLGCGQEGNLVCQDCLSAVEVAPYQFCPFCQKPNRVFAAGKCRSHQNHKLDGLFSAAPLENILVKKMILLFKYEPFLKTLAKPLSFLIISHFLLSENKIIGQNRQNSVFVPVPLSNRRQRWRGYNQSALIAQELSDFFKIPMLTDNLIKVKKTSSQVELSREQRQKNIKDAFVLKNPADIAGKTIFLIDDVFTSGATAEECACVLKAGAASAVWGVTVAREGLH